ncbi:MAG: polysaccharide deacetylase family protein [Ktedonobacteraceae bacterium]
MNLVAFSIRTKGAGNFARRLWTVFTRFGFSEAQTRRALLTVVNTLRQHNAAPTFFIPAVVLGRHPSLLTEIAASGAEIGVHGYVHNDYRLLSKNAQFEQTKEAAAVFQQSRISFGGFRNPYLGWTEDSLRVFNALGFTYDSNEAVLHEIINPYTLSGQLADGYRKSLALFQAIPCSTYTLRPHFEGPLLRIPTSIPDDEMLFDRLRMTDPQEVGRIWSRIMQRVYDLGGVYVLNLHPERAVLCQEAIRILLSTAEQQALPVWVAALRDMAAWWKERSQFQLHITPLGTKRWQITANCTPRATVLVRHLTVEDQASDVWFGDDQYVRGDIFTVTASRCPCIGISAQTPREVSDFLHEQGYPTMEATPEETDGYGLFVDMPGGFAAERAARIQQCSDLVERIEASATPLVRFGCWPDGKRAALAITGDIDSVTIQDFFLRIVEVRQNG